MRRTVPPSAEIPQQIDALLAQGVPATDAEGALSQLARLGARLIIQRAVEDEFDAFLGARALRAPPGRPARQAQRLAPASRPDRRGRARDRDPASSRGRRDLHLEAVPARVEAPHPDRAAEGDGRWRFRARALDARRRVAVRPGRTRPGDRVNGVAHLPGAAGALPRLVDVALRIDERGDEVAAVSRDARWSRCRSRWRWRCH